MVELINIVGAPGTGKTSLARTLSYRLFSIDDYDGKYLPMYRAIDANRSRPFIVETSGVLLEKLSPILRRFPHKTILLYHPDYDVLSQRVMSRNVHNNIPLGRIVDNAELIDRTYRDAIRVSTDGKWNDIVKRFSEAIDFALSSEPDVFLHRLDGRIGRKKTKAQREQFNQHIKQSRLSGNWIPRDRMKERAKSSVRKALKNGKLKKPKLCQECRSSRATSAHHFSYKFGRELDVIFVCRRCHEELDREREAKEQWERSRSTPGTQGESGQGD